MSTPAESGPAEGKSGDRRLSLGKYVKRMSSVFKREKSSKSTTSPLITPAAPSPPQGQPQPSREALAKEVADVAAFPVQTPTSFTTTVATPATPTATRSPLDRNATQQERARALFAKYGLTLEQHEWIAAPVSASALERVEKPIRMRVHRSCHHCGVLYGSEKLCVNCSHKRCKKCPRIPRKKGSPEKERIKAIAEKAQKKRVLTITTRAGNELAHQPTKQRVKRTCHKCEAVFIPPTATVCEQCRHVRCTKCPREPAKLLKWPNGYPGDVDADSDSEAEKQMDKFRRTWRKPRQIVRWKCEQCQSSFIKGIPECPGCGHERCDRCSRSPAKKAKKEDLFDPDVVAAVEAKLRALGVDHDPPTSEPEAV